MLYRLSYSRTKMAPAEGLEPPTPGLGNRRSIRLSYAGITGRTEARPR